MGAADANMVAVAASDVVDNADGRTLLVVSNQGGSTDNVGITIQNATQYTAAGVPLTASSAAFAVLTTQRWVLGPFSPSLYNNSSGQITITHSFTTSVKITCLGLPQF
jgi:hypothetical protein